MTTSAGPRLPAVGDVVQGRFRIEAVLGQGGMGVVFGAKELGSERPIALKVLAPEASVHPDAVGRFVNEARAAMQLESRHVVKVFEVGTLEMGLPFIVMEMLQGKDLSEVMEQKKTLPIPEAVDYVTQAADAIADAHAHRIVHRDLKPSNLFLTTANLVKVLDFGVSKVQAPPNQRGGPKTATGAVLGSPHYMAPEQLKSAKDADPRADIWSLGVILYELLAGRPPFEGRSYGDLFMAVLSGQFVPLSTVRADVPPALEEIVARCLKKSRDERFPTVADLVAALRPFRAAAAKRALASTAVMEDRPRGLPDMPPRASAHVPAFRAPEGASVAPPPSIQPAMPGMDRRATPSSLSRLPVTPPAASPPVAPPATTPKKGLAIGIAVAALVAVLVLVLVVFARRTRSEGHDRRTPTTEPGK